ncbi:MAG: hypothetical protein ACRDZ6_12305, partial [Acidimicrobiales bacterium]
SLVANGPRLPEVVYWAGKASFPMTVETRPRSCLAGYFCNPTHTRFSHGTRRLYARRLWYCVGNIPPGFVFHEYIWIVDKTGHRTPGVRLNIPCRP